MAKQSPFVKSSFPRKLDDDYKTIDDRCVHALLNCIPNLLGKRIVDVCAPSGSGIVDTLKSLGQKAVCSKDAFGKIPESYAIVTNPPYKRELVDKIIKRQIERVANHEVIYFAALLRSTFDHATSRVSMFAANHYYLGQIKLLFRPWWDSNRDAQPIHNFVWHIWYFQRDPINHKIVMYDKGILNG